MKLSETKRRASIYVCAHRRRDDDPLGGGCGSRGDAVYEAIRSAIGARAAWSRAWVAKTSCLGVCPRVGCAVGVAPTGAVLDECEPEDADVILDTLSV